MRLSDSIAALGRINPKLACETFWKFSHVEGGKESIEPILMKASNVDYPEYEKFLKTNNLVSAAHLIVEGNAVNIRDFLSEAGCKEASKTADDMKDAVKQIVESSRKQIDEWRRDFIVNGEKHPEKHYAICDLLGRAIRGELLNPEDRLHTYNPFETAKIRLLKYLSSDDSDNFKLVWEDTWNRTLEIMERANGNSL